MTCGAATYFQYLSLHSLFSVSALKHTDHGIFDADRRLATRGSSPKRDDKQ
jgi:hypothetical protein